MVHRRTVLATCGVLSAGFLSGCSTEGSSEAETTQHDTTATEDAPSSDFRPSVPDSLDEMNRTGNEWVGSTRGDPHSHGVLIWNSGTASYRLNERIFRDGERIYEGQGRTVNPETYALIRLRGSARYRYRLWSTSTEVKFRVSKPKFEKPHSATVVEFTDTGAAARTVADADWHHLFTETNRSRDG